MVLNNDEDNNLFHKQAKFYLKISDKQIKKGMFKRRVEQVINGINKDVIYEINKKVNYGVKKRRFNASVSTSYNYMPY